MKPRALSFRHSILTVILIFSLFDPSLSWAIPAQGQKIMIAGPSPAAVEVGKEIAKRGGNAVDVAVGVALSLAVTHPYYAALGGGGFALTKMGREVRALDFRETAPAKAGADLYKDRPSTASTDGGLAVGVPGIPAGLWELHKTYGKLKWQSLFTGAIRLADRGFEVSGEWARITTKNKDRFTPAGKTLFSKKNSATLRPGDLLRQPGLAILLRRMSENGPKAFYQGLGAQDLVRATQESGGILSLEDLRSYKTRWLEPLSTEFIGHKVYLMPPPSSGGIVLIQALELAKRVQLSTRAALSVDELHLITEIFKLSYRGRSLLGDPAFVSNPLAQLRSDTYLASLAAQIKTDHALDVEPLKEVSFEQGNTTHFSVMDSSGNTVAMTLTLNGEYGSGVVSSRYGVALNNEMDDFTTKPGQPNIFGLVQGEANQVRVGARPLSSMSPTIVEKDGRTVLSLGSPGGPRIISAVFQVLYRSLTQPFDIDQAIQAPRVHHQFLPNVLYTDNLRLPPETLDALRARGHKVETGSTAKVYAVQLSPDGLLSGAFDSRGEGAAGGF